MICLLQPAQWLQNMVVVVSLAPRARKRVVDAEAKEKTSKGWFTLSNDITVN